MSHIVTQSNSDGSKIIAVTAADGTTVSVTKKSDGTYTEPETRSKNGEIIPNSESDSRVDDIKAIDTAETRIVTITSEKIP